MLRKESACPVCPAIFQIRGTRSRPLPWRPHRRPGQVPAEQLHFSGNERRSRKSPISRQRSTLPLPHKASTLSGSLFWSTVALILSPTREGADTETRQQKAQ